MAWACEAFRRHFAASMTTTLAAEAVMMAALTMVMLVVLQWYRCWNGVGRRRSHCQQQEPGEEAGTAA